MQNFDQLGYRLTLTPPAAVTGGQGQLFGALFGVALGNVAANTPGEFITRGVVNIAKTSALAIAVGDVLYWDPANRVVNRTTLGQRGVGVAVAAAGNPSSTVLMRIGVDTIPGT